ncbi:hypothetical protein [Paracidobacterium acidisoli]|uniref:hypothetical protein n=1 Tax=Paracidobacterium acidisoli TaxID=2303751 RepID=UPI0011C11081|nr:hypothetical protein [Paracidobacterium acidisoli]
MSKRVLSALLLAASVVAGQAQSTTAPKKEKPETEEQKRLDQVTEQMLQLQRQLDAMKEQLQQAKDASAAAQARADEAEKKSDAVQQGLGENSQAVSGLQTSVSDLKASTSVIVQQAADGQKKILAEQKKTNETLDHPDVLHYKGVTLSPAGSYVAGETVWRAHSTGADIPTPFTSIPFPQAEGYHLSEFDGTSRQSRIALMGEGKTTWGTMRGYWEADWLGTGITSNNNQSNSYVFRQRVIWGQALLNNGWGVAGGQMWSLATEDAKGLSNLSGDILTPQTIDPNYNPGFVWTRQYGFRVTRNIGDKVVVGVALENPQVLGPGGTLGNVNPGITYIYANPGSSSGLTNTGGTDTTGSLGQATQYAISKTPDFIVKAAFDPGVGHYEIFGIGRSFRDRVYNSTTSSAFTSTVWGGGIGASARVPVAKKKLSLGLKGMYGSGTGRYGDSTIADVTVKPDGTFEPLKSLSALASLDWAATPRLSVYAYYGGDYIGRMTYQNTAGKYQGYGVPGSETNSGCGSENLTPGGPTFPSSGASCTGTTRDVQEGTLGYWFDFYRGPKGRLRQGFQYSYTTRGIWATLPGYAPKAIEQGIWTSFRYYLP